MSSTLGSRIRQIRKHQKKTLTDIAGNHLTKGMLSLIENDKAQPSMDSLHHIAKVLGVEINTLLEEHSIYDLRKMILNAHELYKNRAFNEVIQLLEPYLSVEKVHSYELATLATVYAKSLYMEKDKGWQDYLQLAESYFQSMHLYNEIAPLDLFKIAIFMWEKKYDQSLAYLREKRQEYEDAHIELDIIHELGFRYHEVGCLIFVGEIEEALSKVDENIIYQTKHKHFYRMDEYYRIAIIFSMIDQQEERMIHYLTKLDLLCDLFEDKNMIGFSLFLKAHIYNEYYHDYTKALTFTDELQKLFDDDVLYIEELETGKALYGLGQYEKALLSFKDLEQKDLGSLLELDQSLLVPRYSYQALCYEKLGDHTKAVTLAKKAQVEMKKLIKPIEYYNRFVNETYKQLTEQKKA
ncbi:helix-turn-helix domain-containing protein [Alkalihalobacillus pseudalcaliphilus]|uniref:helix-turn-helix domain-containing protein n=1 Tax=Alkalihalobacillus pseudalcaliphilus TaxID=79884 RepID=UPI00064DA6A8|nr:helix-turn-helix transcriptional regulator [Alkalihalobacillus pseudalcaliphilus]KMK76211.1 hypothetical protein AB990_13425 [Alkalihalobacillus pseudalcaliphilus]